MLRVPWHSPLGEWGDEFVVPLPRGISRHVLRIVRVWADVYVVKETREAMALEYPMLRDLNRLGLPTA